MKYLFPLFLFFNCHAQRPNPNAFVTIDKYAVIIDAGVATYLTIDSNANITIQGDTITCIIKILQMYYHEKRRADSLEVFTSKNHTDYYLKQ